MIEITEEMRNAARTALLSFAGANPVSTDALADAVLAAVAPLIEAQMPAWQPIETAPTERVHPLYDDGPTVLVWVPGGRGGGWRYLASCDASGKWWTQGDQQRIHPTLWMPVTVPPGA